MNQKVRDVLFIILLILVILFMAYVISFILKWKAEFTENPMVFGAKRLKNVSCECTKLMSSVRTARFSFNDNEWIGSVSQNVNYVPQSFDNINITHWENMIVQEDG